MRSRLILGTMSSLGLAAPLLVLAATSSHAADVNITNDPTHVWGAPILAVNPKNPNNIVLSSIGNGFTKPCAEKAKTDANSTCATFKTKLPATSGGTQAPPNGMINNEPGFVMVAAFASFDGGKTWKKTGEVKEGGNIGVFAPDKYKGPASADANGLTVTPDGTFLMAWDAVYFSDIPLYATFGAIPISKSTDGGKTWSKPIYTGSSPDGGRLDVDPSTGLIYTWSSGMPGAGPMSLGDPAIRITAEKGHTGMSRHFLTSKDGVTWSEPHIIGGGGGTMTVARGMLATGFKTTAATEGYLGSGRSPANNDLCGSGPKPCLIFQTTKDGGATWDRHVMPVLNDYGNPIVAADPTKPGHFAVAFSANRESELHIFRTADAGATWGAPSKLTAEAARTVALGSTISNVSMEYGPTGVLGVVWKTRNPPLQLPAQGGGGSGGGPNRSAFNVLAAVSKDGGTTFSQPVRMNSTESPAPPGDRQFALSRDGGASIVVTGDNVLVAWPDWRTEEASIMFSSVKLSDFK